MEKSKHEYFIELLKSFNENVVCAGTVACGFQESGLCDIDSMPLTPGRLQDGGKNYTVGNIVHENATYAIIVNPYLRFDNLCIYNEAGDVIINLEEKGFDLDFFF